jgi:hypothetical protein
MLDCVMRGIRNKCALLGCPGCANTMTYQPQTVASLDYKIETQTMTLTILTIIHTLLSLVGIASGALVARALLVGKLKRGLTALFLASTVLTSTTAFLFPFHQFKPSHVIAVVSLLILTIVILARSRFHYAGRWGQVYAIGAISSLYLNCFVLIAQLFGKVPLLRATAPTQSEPAFLGTQLAVLALFILIAVRASAQFPPSPSPGSGERIRPLRTGV